MLTDFARTAAPRTDVADVCIIGVGENVGAAYYPLEDSRLRFFGGTTNIWGGRWSPAASCICQRQDAQASRTSN